MSSADHQSESQSNRVVERLLGAAGGAILAGALAVWVINLFRDVIPSGAIPFIAGIAGGAVSIAQRYLATQNARGEKK